MPRAVLRSGHSNTVQWGYDDENNLTSQTQTLNGTTYTTSYAYDTDNRLTQSTTGTTSANYTYDAYSRMTGITAKNGSSTVVSTSITYKNPSTTTTSTQVNKWTTGGKTYTYTYDSRGNITAISDGSNTTTYVYDSLDQLTRENNQAAGKTWVYTYDNGGNILSKKEYAYTTGTLGTVQDTISYGYGDSAWKDLLTSYDGQTLTTDAIGNLTNDGTWTYSWQHGRQLAQMSKPNGSGTENVNYTYDAAGHRIAKEHEMVVEVDGEVYRNGSTAKYTYLGDTLTDMQWVEVDGSVSSFHFTYDATGPMSMTFYGTEYFYLKNAQGDVTGLVDSSGTQVVAYTYDAWGNILSTTGSMAGSLGYTNPFRYRSYFYDTETGLYYVSSRYYNSKICRFINGDSLVTDLQGLIGLNLFSYCGNNPINRADPSGMFWKKIGSWFKEVSRKIEQFLTPSNAYGTFVSGLSIVSAAVASSVVGAIKSSPRPNNIGVGTYAKICQEEIRAVSKISNGASKIFTAAAYGAAAIDVGIGIYDNVKNGASAKKIILDAAVDAAITGGSIWAAGALGSAIGTTIGTIIPGAGNIVGAGVGFVIGIGIYALTDMVYYNGKTARTWVKEGVNNLW